MDVTGDPINKAYLAISALTQETDQGSYQPCPSTQFKFLGNNFDGLKFHYDHLNSDEYVVKAKAIRPQQLVANVSAYLMRCAVMTQYLFEFRDESYQAEHRLSKEVADLKYNLKGQTEKDGKATKKLVEVTKKKEDVKATLASSVQEIEKLKDSNEQLKLSLKEAQVDILYIRDDDFERAKTQAMFL